MKRDTELQNKIDQLQVTLDNHIEKISETEKNPQKNESEISPLTPEEIAGKTLAYNAIQTACIITIAFAAYIYTAAHYDVLVSLLAGGCLGIIFGLIAHNTIKKLGFKIDPNLTKISYKKVIPVLFCSLFL